jgi:hypothetical protein
MRDLFLLERLNFGRMLSGSKSGYMNANPDHEVYFNANVFTREGKLWWGDLDITIDAEKLQNIAEAMGEKLYVLREMDGRFENEEISEIEIMKKAVFTTN